MIKALSESRFENIFQDITIAVHTYMKNMGFTENADGEAWNHLTRNALNVVAHELQNESRAEISRLIQAMKPKVLLEGNSNRALPCVTRDEAVKIEKYYEYGDDPARDEIMSEDAFETLSSKLLSALIYTAAYEAQYRLRGQERN